VKLQTVFPFPKARRERWSRWVNGFTAPMGGAQLTPEQVSAVAAYVWAISHGATANRE